ncbi:TetR family transcriptional regulator [Nocardia sp. NBC_01503]|uniref:TetR/AcrR family transcriptional regulator n=1 Tax=Nocardia sp. NBC_01503 TaxID=2975997 RepID=UPI002E7C192E|nr:TetR family transcriptional regulator [Nocardia sp. NBC_01503]WTL31105.1 TetR family transcriptional regulator [Nocardia sp. NBC_01503]
MRILGVCDISVILAAAAEFGAYGYAGARIGAISARAGVNVQLISSYFDGKEGLYQAVSQQWQERQRDLVAPGTPLPEQLRTYALESLHNPEGARLLAWTGLQYTGPADDPDHEPRARMLTESVEELRALQDAGQLPADLDPAYLLVMLMAAAMAPTTLPHVVEGVCGADPRSPEFLARFADQLATLSRHLGLG